MQQKTYTSITRTIALIAVFLIGMTLAACISPSVPPELPATAEEAPTATPQPEEVDDSLSSDETSETEQQSSSPVQISMPELDLTMPVTPMGWRVIVVDGTETTTWNVPDESLGWQINSAAPGADGNMLIIGHQALGDALLAPLALDEVTAGQELVVTDNAGATFLYQISEVSDPIPVTGASADEEAQAAAYTALDGDARLTLITGWPDFTTTHRIFAVAQLVGSAE